MKTTYSYDKQALDRALSLLNQIQVSGVNNIRALGSALDILMNPTVVEEKEEESNGQ